ncbi:MAG: hypothetical protein EU533_00270 [Promethearchaeota archaeon]|nr:MAG: hypothetical protein EU533_00270 [Candidatus Lokiarchaeota archaeon]
MSILTEEEIEKLKEDNPKKKIVRYFFLISGVAIFILGILFFLLGIDFNLILLDLNFSFIVDLLLIIIGMILISKYYIAAYYIRENSIVLKKTKNLREPVSKSIKFNSFAFTRLIAAILLIVAGFLSLSIFGTDVGHEVPYGSAVFLGGPSWFYVTGLPALGFGFGLLLYFFLSPFRGIFSKSENFFFFYEIHPGFPWLTEIPIKDIEMIRYQNNYLGPKLMWIPAFFPFIVMQLMTSLALFSAERAAPEHTLSWTFLIISIIEIISLIILVFFQQKYYEIATNSRLYEMWFAPLSFKNRQDFDKEFSDFLGCNIEFKGKPVDNINSFEDLSTKHFKISNLIFGGFLILLSLIILNNMIIFGPLFWWFALIYGFILIAKFISQDLSKEIGDSIKYDKQTKSFTFNRKLFLKFQYYSALNVETVRVKKWFRKLDAFDVLFISGLMLFSTLQLGFGWAINDSFSVILDNTITTLIWVIMFFIIFAYTCVPIDVIEISTKTITYHIPITKKGKIKSYLRRYFVNLKMSLKFLRTEEMKKVFYLRSGMLFSIIIGVIIYLLIYFVFLF